jgi:hypothetical protein
MKTILVRYKTSETAADANEAPVHAVAGGGSAR